MIPTDINQVNNNIYPALHSAFGDLSRKYAGSRSEINIDNELIQQARSLNLYKTDKSLFLLIGKILEASNWCEASRQALSSMLSEKTGKLLGEKQMSRVTSRLAALKLITKCQTVKRGQCSQNSYSLTDLGWALFYIYRHRITENKKCPTVKPKNVPPLITLSINDDPKNTSLPSTEILSSTESPNLAKKVPVSKILNSKLCGLPNEVAEVVRTQVMEYVSYNTVINPHGLINKIISRESELHEVIVMGQKNKSMFACAVKAQCDALEADKKATEDISSKWPSYPTDYDKICEYRLDHASAMQKFLHPPKATESPMPAKEPHKPHWLDNR